MRRNAVQMAMKAINEDAKQRRAERAALPYPILLKQGGACHAANPHGERATGV